MITKANPVHDPVNDPKFGVLVHLRTNNARLEAENKELLEALKLALPYVTKVVAEWEEHKNVRAFDSARKADEARLAAVRAAIAHTEDHAS